MKEKERKKTKKQGKEKEDETERNEGFQEKFGNKRNQKEKTLGDFKELGGGGG